MAGKIIARGQMTIAGISDGKTSHPYIRYSDDGGKTFTAARPITQEQADAPGRNLARGTADFSGGKANWNMDYRIKPTDEKYIGLTVIRIPDSWNQAGSIVPCRAGKTYTFSFWARVDELKGDRCGGVIRNCRKGEHYEYVSYDGIKTGNSLYLTYTKEWKRHTFVLRFLKDAPNAAFSVEKDRNDNTLFVCGFKVEEGETATPWSPAPEDQQRGTTPGEWMGVAFSDKGYPPFDVNEYTWSRTKGDPGKGVKSVVRYFGLSDSPAREPKSWSPEAVTPTDEMPYLWSFDRITYTDGTSVDTAHAVAGAKGSQAEFHRLRTVAETASVGTDNVLKVLLSYEIEHVRGAQVTAVAGDRKGIHVTAHTSAGAEIPMTAGERNEGHYRLTDYSKQESRPDYIVVELKDGADRTLDSRTVQVMMEAASYVDVVGDLRTTVSQHGRNISRIEQKADGISLKVEGMKNGVRNLLKGGRLNVSFSTYGLPSAFRLKLKPDTDYTLTVCGRISEDAWDKRQMIRTYVFDKDWKWSADFDVQSTSDTAASVTFRIPADRHSPEDYYVSCFPFPNQEPKGRNGEVTVSWLVLTEGTQAAASWIPAEGETGEEKAAEVEARLENGEFRVKSDRTVFVDGNGKETVLIKDGKLSAELIDAVKLVAAGIRAQTIDAQNAVFRNITVEGESKFKGTIETEDGSIAGWKIKRGMIGYGVDSDGLSIFDDCLVYNFHKKDKQVIIGDSPLGVYFGKAISASFTNGVDDGMEKIGVFVDMKSSPAQANNYAVYAQGGTYGGFRRSLRVISDDAELKKWDSAVLFTGTRRKKITLPASPEDGEEFIVYIANYLNDDLEFATTDGSGVDFHHDVYETGTDYNMTRPIRKHVLHVVYSRRGNTWCVF